MATGAIDLTGNSLDNSLSGNAGDNILNGGAGADLMQGFGGNDRYYVDNALDQVIEASGGGTDILLTSVSYTLSDGMFVETLATTDMAATGAIDLTGNSLANALSGNAGANVLNGGGGNDTLVGLGGADTLQGGGGNDSLIGGLGADSLSGGTGADLFRFDSALGGGNVDTILDFAAADDNVLLDDAVFTGLAAGALAAGAFVTGAAAADADDRIIYDSTTGALLFDVDGVGGAAAIQFATLQTGLTLTASDFFVI
jgi:Ca2+-binding RTX toxin-like protein